MRFICALLLGLVLSGCDEYTSPLSTDHTVIVQPTLYQSMAGGQRVLYFPAILHSYGESLSSWLVHNPTCNVVAMAGNGTGYNGFEQGYFVVVNCAASCK